MPDACIYIIIIIQNNCVCVCDSNNKNKKKTKKKQNSPVCLQRISLIFFHIVLREKEMWNAQSINQSINQIVVVVFLP